MNILEEFDTKIQAKQRLIQLNNERLQVRKEQKAQFGIMADPFIITEIKQIETELEQLFSDLEQLKREKAMMVAPLVHFYTFGTANTNIPKNELRLIWSDVFDGSVIPRKIPGPDIWENRLMDELTRLEKKIASEKLAPEGLVRIEGKIALSAGFAFGHIFSRVGQYRLAIISPQTWQSDESWTEQTPEFSRLVIEGSADATNLGVVVNAIRNQDSHDLLTAVQNYMNQQGGLKKVLLLEAKMTTEQGKDMQGREAAVLARTSQARLRSFVSQNPAKILHIFMAAPAGLAVFLGHYWNAIGIKAQFHEWVQGDIVYAPACQFGL